MQRAPTPSLLLEVWREVCRHIDIGESLERIAPILAQTLPVTRVLVRRVDRDARRLLTIAEGTAAKRTAEAAPPRKDLDAGGSPASPAGEQDQVRAGAPESGALRRASLRKRAPSPPDRAARPRRMVDVEPPHLTPPGRRADS
jgi:hypothetical protein